MRRNWLGLADPWLGPFSDLYEPAWFPEKRLAGYAEGAATVAAIAGSS